MPIRSAQESERVPALELLLSELPAEVRPARVERFANWFATQRLNPDGLLVALEGKQLLGVLHIHQSIGNTASISLPRLTDPTREDLAIQLVSMAVERLKTWSVDYAQAALEPAEYAWGRILLRGGFQDLTTLEFYGRPTAPELTPIPWPVDVEIRPFGPGQDQLLISTLFATYEETLDCPELNGIRQPKDVLSEYYSMSYLPQKWWILFRRREPIGVLLLSPGAKSSCELSYFGLVSTARRQGLGQRLFRFALAEAQRLGSEVTLSMDERNAPARQLYLQAGFQLQQMRRIYWWHLSSSAR